MRLIHDFPQLPAVFAATDVPSGFNFESFAGLGVIRRKCKSNPYACSNALSVLADMLRCVARIFTLMMVQVGSLRNLGNGLGSLVEKYNVKRGWFMAGTIYRYLADDHRRLEALLERATSRPDQIEAFAYAEFRAGLLKHIGMEEKILLPAAQRHRGGEPLPIAAKIRLDHGALAALLVPSPTPSIVAALRAILNEHNVTEESPGGVYEECENLTGAEGEKILAELRSTPEVKVMPHNDGPKIIEATRRALARAGYTMEIEP